MEESVPRKSLFVADLGIHTKSEGWIRCTQYPVGVFHRKIKEMARYKALVPSQYPVPRLLYPVPRWGS